MICTFQLHNISNADGKWLALLENNLSRMSKQFRDPSGKGTVVQTAIQTKVWKRFFCKNSGRHVTETKQQFYIDFFWHINIYFSPSPFADKCYFHDVWHFVVEKGSVTMSVVFCSIYTYVSFHMSTVLTHAQRFWEVQWNIKAHCHCYSHHCEGMLCCLLLWDLSNNDVRLSRTPSGVDSLNCHCVAADVTSFHQVGCHGDGRWLWWSISLRRNKLYLSLSGQQGGMVTRACIVTRPWGSRLVFDLSPQLQLIKEAVTCHDSAIQNFLSC